MKNKISVLNLTPTLPEELTSKSYVDSQVGSSVKLDSVNTFTANQNISGDLKANNVVVLNTTPTLNTQLTSKLYVDTALNGKQNTLLAGQNITISGNTISSTSSTSGTSVVFIASRAGTHLITNRTVVPFNVVILNTGGGYSGSTYTFTAPIAGAYHFNMSINRVPGKIGSCDIRYYDGSTDVIKQQISIANATPNNCFMDLAIYCKVGDQVYCKTN